VIAAGDALFPSSVRYGSILLQNQKITHARNLGLILRESTICDCFASQLAQKVLRREIASRMYSPSLKGASLPITARIFSTLPEKEFFNRIGRGQSFGNRRLGCLLEGTGNTDEA